MLRRSELNNCRWFQVSFAFLMLVVTSANLAFAGSAIDTVQVHGFAMQSYTKTSSNNFFGSSSGKGSIDYRELGLNFSIRPMSKLQFASQVLSRKAGNTDEGKLKLDFAVLDYRLIDVGRKNFGIRVGRVKGTFGFYNDTRDVSFTRESVILPQSIYFERTRDVSLSSDGLFAYGSLRVVGGNLDAQYAVVRPRVEGDSLQYALLGEEVPGSFKGKPSLGGRLKYTSANSNLEIALSNVVIYIEYEPGALETNFTKNGELKFNLNILSFRYNLMRWTFTSEYARRSFLYKNFPISYIPDPSLASSTGESFYFQAIFRPIFKWNLILRYDVLYADIDDKNGFGYVETLSPKSVNNFTRFAKDAMIGMQWNVSRNWMLRIEYHNIDGTAWLPRQDNQNPAAEKRYWNMVNASVSYRF